MNQKKKTKRKKEDDNEEWKPTKKRMIDQPGICILHINDSKKKAFVKLKADSKSTVLDKLKGIAEKRLNENANSAHRMEEVSQNLLSGLASFKEDTHGYHRDCYVRFTRNIDRLKSAGDDESKQASSTILKRPKRNSADRIIFTKDCIFCNKYGFIHVKKDGVATTEGVSSFDGGGGVAIHKHAAEINDVKLLTRIQGYDLFSCEAKYHNSCRMKFLNIGQDTSSRSSEETKTYQAEMIETHQKAFVEVEKIISEEVIKKQVILKFYVLLDAYRDFLRGTRFANDGYRAAKLMDKIVKQPKLSSKVSFCFPSNKYNSYQMCLVFSKGMKIDDAVRKSFELGIAFTDRIKETALEIRQEILSSFKNHSKNETWPPMPETMPEFQSIVPSSLQSLIQIIISGSATNESEKVTQLMSSISQDICRAATKGKWNLPKHILLGMTLRHLFRSAEVSVILNRFGHIPDYSFLLELESALAKAMDQSSHLLTNSIVRNPSCKSVFHSDFDNFDEYVSSLTGAGSIHRAHGIMLQELLPEVDQLIGGSIPEAVSVDKTHERSYKFTPIELSEDNLYMGIRKNPCITIHTTDIPGGADELKIMILDSLVWVLLRLTSAECEEQEHPGWSGYISLMGTVPPRLTTIDYYPVIPHPITDYSTVMETLRVAEEAGKEVGQDYHIVTYDLGVCLKAYPLLWNYPNKYNKHIVLIGTFHIVCAYMKMLAKKMKGSGFSDILIESGLMSSGSMVSVLSGKGYSRAMNCHKSLLEGLERLLMTKFLDSEENEVVGRVKQQILIHKTKPNCDLKSLVADEDVRSLMSKYNQYRREVKGGIIGVTAKLWLLYMDHVWLILSLLHAVKTNNYLEYAYCMTLLPDLFFAFGGQNYARYLTYFGVFLANIDHSHPGALQLIKNGVFSVARSFVPGSRSATDKTIEETFMKHSKSRGGSGGAGMVGILHNQDAYQRWVRTARERTKFYQATLQTIGMERDPKTNKHKENRKSEIKKSEAFVAQIIESITDYGNPFDISDTENLYCLSSGSRVDKEVMEDVLRADTEGEKAKLKFIEERLGEGNREKKGKDGEGVFFDKIPRMKLKNMASQEKVTLTKSDKTKVQYKGDGSFVYNLLVQLQKLGTDVVNLRNFVSYPLTPIVYSLGTYDGFLSKTNKAKGFHWLTKKVSNAKYPDSDSTTVIEDGNAIFHCMNNIPNTFGDIAEKTFDMASKGKNMIFSTDMYKPLSVKTMERARRGTSSRLLIGGPKTRKPVDWKEFLKNSDNKRRFIEILLEVWSSKNLAPKLIDKKVTLICEGKAFELSSNGEEVLKREVPEIESNQEETDTRVVMYCFHAKNNGYKSVVVRSPDSDIFYILLSYIHDLEGITVYFETGKKNKKRLINITEIGKHYSEKYCKALLALHAFTGCDTTSAFKGKGKVRAIKWLLKDTIILNALSKLGDTWALSDDVISGLERLVCRLYGSQKINDVNECRYLKLTSACCSDDLNVVHPTKKFDTALIPPCKSSLIEHCKRAHYQVAQWKRSHIQFPLIPGPLTDNGWCLDSHGHLVPVWYTGQMLPQSIINELPADKDDEEDEDEDVDKDEEDVEDIDYSEFIADMFNEDEEEEEFEGFSEEDV